MAQSEAEADDMFDRAIIWARLGVVFAGMGASDASVIKETIGTKHYLMDGGHIVGATEIAAGLSLSRFIATAMRYPEWGAAVAALINDTPTAAEGMASLIAACPIERTSP